MTASEGSYRELEQKLKDGLASISADIVDKYGNLKVALNINATAKLIFDRLENLEDISEMSTRDMAKFIEECEKENPETLADIKSQAN
uniref:Centromere/kinetochore protein zw10 N-terminal domain-containing protein n=1 Tax=Caenorhabditis japonica TaxID=281687 RepID=A0A8R1IHX8_CAEJA